MSYAGHVHQEVVKQLPDVVGSVDLFHLHLGVHIAVIHKVHIRSLHLEDRDTERALRRQHTLKATRTATTEFIRSTYVTFYWRLKSIHLSVCWGLMSHLHLWDAVDVSHHFDDVVQRQQRVALELGVDVLALGAGGQQLHQCVVVGQRAVIICALSLRRHHLQQHREGRAVVVEHQHVFATVHQLEGREGQEVSSLGDGRDRTSTRGRSTPALAEVDMQPLLK